MQKTTKETKTVNTNIFAVIDVNGLQVEVREGDTFEVENLGLEKGDKVAEYKTLLVSQDDKATVGKPYLENVKVDMVVDANKKGEKVLGYKYKAKSRYRKTFGSRQQLTRVLVKKITIS